MDLVTLLLGLLVVAVIVAIALQVFGRPVMPAPFGWVVWLVLLVLLAIFLLQLMGRL